MSPIVIEAEQVPAQAWRNGGGQTRELLVWPPQESLGGIAICVGKGGGRAADGGHGAERSAAQTPAPASSERTRLATPSCSVNSRWMLPVSKLWWRHQRFSATPSVGAVSEARTSMP